MDKKRISRHDVKNLGGGERGMRSMFKISSLFEITFPNHGPLSMGGTFELAELLGDIGMNFKQIFHQISQLEK